MQGGPHPSYSLPGAAGQPPFAARGPVRPPGGFTPAAPAALAGPYHGARAPHGHTHGHAGPGYAGPQHGQQGGFDTHPQGQGPAPPYAHTHMPAGPLQHGGQPLQPGSFGAGGLPGHRPPPRASQVSPDPSSAPHLAAQQQQPPHAVKALQPRGTWGCCAGGDGRARADACGGACRPPCQARTAQALPA